MKEALTYFKAERAESLIFIGTGIVAILTSLWFWLSLKRPFYNGAAATLTAVAIIQIIVGTTILFRTPADIKRIETILTHDPAKIRSEELPRMEKVMHNFVTYCYAEITLGIISLALIFFFKEPGYWKGFGAGLLVQSILMLVFDYFAASRGKVYLEFLRGFGDSVIRPAHRSLGTGG